MKVNKNINILSLKIWLITMITLVSLIVFVGGLTRLTESGLSITVWEVFKGVFPPLNLQEWNNYFNDYKKIPEYKLLNTEMSLDEFKVIFYWEYSHRMLARLLGFLSIIPLIYFSITYKAFLNNYKRYLKKVKILLKKSCKLTFLGGKRSNSVTLTEQSIVHPLSH